MQGKSLLNNWYEVTCYNDVYFTEAVFTSYNGPIAGGKTISDCVNGSRKSYSDLDITTSEFIRKEGYPVEEHFLSTEDGYLLTLHRIPGAIGAPVVYLLHGVAQSSFDFVVIGKDNALAFLLANQGYDVWLGNQRGNVYARCHETIDPESQKFWDFSFHEIGIYDLPAQISYIKSIAGTDGLTYIGHSMGATSFFVLATEKPEVATNVKAMFALAPAVYNYYLRGVGIWASPTANILTTLSQYVVHGEVFSSSYKPFVDIGCGMLPKICLAGLFFLIGFDRHLINPDQVQLFFHHFPAGSSSKSFNHLAQSGIRNTFKKYDYGVVGNIQRYASIDPPDYDLTKVRVPVGLFYGANDYLSNPQDSEKLWSLLPNKIIKYEVPFKKFNHFDFIWANAARELVYEKLLSEMKMYK